MLGQHFARLAAVAKLVDTDISPRPSTIQEDGDKFVVTYYGTYTRGTVLVPNTETNEIGTVVVGSPQLRDIAGLFDGDEEISLSVIKNNLVLKGSSCQAALRVMEDDPAEPVAGLDAVEADGVNIPFAVFGPEIDIAAGFVNERTQSPVLGGVRLTARGGKMSIMAYDGRAGIYSAIIEVDGGAAFDITVPPKDLKASLALINNAEDVRLQLFRNVEGQATRLVLIGDDAVIHTALLEGKWPNVSSLMRKAERQSVVLPADRLACVLAGSKALSADPLIILEQANDGLRVRTKESELGIVAVGLEAQVGLNGFPNSLMFDFDTIRLAATLGKSIVMEVAEDHKIPVMVQADHRRYWVQRRAG